jgi:hypothetical protein
MGRGRGRRGWRLMGRRSDCLLIYASGGRRGSLKKDSQIQISVGTDPARRNLPIFRTLSLICVNRLYVRVKWRTCSLGLDGY